MKRLSDAKAKVIAVGDYLQAPSQIDSAQDTQLALSFQTAGNVVTRNQLLRFHNHQGHEKWQLTPPIPEIIRSANSLGFSRGLSDSNNTVRKWLLYQVHENQISESLLIQVIKLYSKNNPNYHIELLDGKYKIKNHNREKFLDQKYSFDMLNQIQIGNFLPELNPFEKLSFVDVLEGNFDPNLIRDSIVVIGPTASGIVEPIQTSLGLVMSPIELETYVLSSVLHEGDTRQSGLVLTHYIDSVFSDFCMGYLQFESNDIHKDIDYSIPVLLIADFLVFWLPDLKLHSNLPMPCLFLVLSALTILSMNYFVERSEKSNIRHAFSHYVTSSVVNQILSQPEKLKLGGERKELSVFFSDIEGFASISERLEIEKLVSLLNEYLTAMTDNIILEHHGMLDKYEGDAIMAIFGAPMDIKNHALQACLAALDNQKLLKTKLYPKWKEQNLPCFKVRIGINTGTMLVGNMGSQSRFDYTVIGDNVNVGSRLETLNKIYGTNILISENTIAHLGDQLVVRKLDRVIVRGKSLTMDVYELVGKSDQVPLLGPNFIKTYEKALDHYFDQNFIAALPLFEQASQMKLIHDKTCNIFIERCKYFISSESRENWDGVFPDLPRG